MKVDSNKKVGQIPPWEQDIGLQPSVTEAVRTTANALHARIVAGQYPYGSRLPPERQIGAEFGVSRTVVRKALSMLEACETVSRQQGRSRVVIFRPHRPEQGGSEGLNAAGGNGGLGDVAETTSPLELNVVRTIFEPEMVRLATINMSARDIANLRRIADELCAVTTNAAHFAQWEEQFHLAIAEGTHNVLLVAVYRMINGVKRHAHWSATREKILSPNRIKEYQRIYRSVCAALEARDIESAVEFAKLSMVKAQRDLTFDT